MSISGSAFSSDLFFLQLFISTLKSDLENWALDYFSDRSVKPLLSSVDPLRLLPLILTGKTTSYLFLRLDSETSFPSIYYRVRCVPFTMGNDLKSISLSMDICS